MKLTFALCHPPYHNLNIVNCRANDPTAHNKSDDEVPPAPVWPKYLYGEKSDALASNKGVQILKERFYQQKVLSAQNVAESNISERKIGNIYSWLEGVRYETVK